MRGPLAIFVVVLPLVAVSAQEGEPGLFATVKAGVASRQLDRSRQLGFTLGKKSYEEIPAEGAVLVGFEVGLGKQGKDEAVLALRALFVSATGEFRSADFGSFAGGAAKAGKGRVTRTARVVADPGYAVSAVSVRSRLGISGLMVTFARVKGRGLDLTKTQTSEWLGDRGKGSEATIGGTGELVVGVFGTQDDDAVLSLGLVSLKPGVAVAKVQPKQPPLEKKAEPPPATPKKAEPPVVAEGKEPEPKRPARGEVERRAEDDEPEAKNDLPKAKAAETPAVAAAPNSTRLWPVVALVGVGVTGGLTLLVFAARPKNLPRGRQTPNVTASAPATPAAPPPLPAAQVLEGFSARPLTTPPPLPRWAAEQAAASQPLFFLARLVLGVGRRRLCRVYLAPGELLFIDAGPEVATDAVVRGAVAGGLVGALVSHYVNETQKNKSANRLAFLDVCDLESLQQLASNESTSFAVRCEDLHGGVLQAQSGWQRLWRRDVVALIHLDHAVSGQLTLEMLRQLDAREAGEHLTRVMGPRFGIRAAWDGSSKRYQPKGVLRT